MKTCLILILILCSCIPIFAQEKSRFVLSGDLLIDILPKEWRSDHVKVTDGYFGPFTNSTFSIAYYYKNRYCLRANYNYLALQSAYTPYTIMPDRSITMRIGTFYDLVIGKNVFKDILPKRTGGWIFAGTGMATDLLQMRGSVNPFNPHELIVDKNRRRSSLHFYPTVQAMLKYDVLPFVFLGAGFTYRYLYSDFNQMSVNFSLGLQI